MNTPSISVTLPARVVLRWLPFAAVSTIISALVLVTVQQNLRLSANDPQIQMAEDAAAAIGAGEPVPNPPPQASVEISSSLAPFLAFYDDGGKVLATNAKLGTLLPSLPPGVFAYVRAHGEDRVTWQPKPGVRIAAIITRYQGKKSGFILAGRSLREVEARINRLEIMVAVAWLAALIASFVLIAYKRDPKETGKNRIRETAAWLAGVITSFVLAIYKRRPKAPTAPPTTPPVAI